MALTDTFVSLLIVDIPIKKIPILSFSNLVMAKRLFQLQTNFSFKDRILFPYVAYLGGIFIGSTWNPKGISCHPFSHLIPTSSSSFLLLPFSLPLFIF
jgi:hypothetical protein